MICCYCGSDIEVPVFSEDENEWNKSIVCECKKCNKIINYAFGEVY